MAWPSRRVAPSDPIKVECSRPGLFPLACARDPNRAADSRVRGCPGCVRLAVAACCLSLPWLAAACYFFYGAAIYFLMKLLFLPECICYCVGVYATVPTDGREEVAWHCVVLNFFLIPMADWF